MTALLLGLALCAPPPPFDRADGAPDSAAAPLAASDGPDASTRESLQVGAGLAALGALTYTSIGVLSEKDDATRAIAAAGGALTGVAVGLMLAAVVGVALEAWDVDEHPGRFAALVITAIAATVGLGITGGFIGWETSRDPDARVGVHLAVGASLGLSLAVPLGALVDAFDVLEAD